LSRFHPSSLHRLRLHHASVDRPLKAIDRLNSASLAATYFRRTEVEFLRRFSRHFSWVCPVPRPNVQ
jgi:hypothetical protein